MSRTNPRAVAAHLWCLPQHADKEMDVAFAESIARALADAERRGMERAAKVAEMFSINKQQIHPDIAWENMSESARMVCHMTCQNITMKIRAQAQADKEAPHGTEAE